MYSFLNTTDLFRSQYSFQSKTCSKAFVRRGKENNKHTIAVFLALFKAFDILKHEVLYKKLDMTPEAKALGGLRVTFLVEH